MSLQSSPYGFLNTNEHNNQLFKAKSSDSVIHRKNPLFDKQLFNDDYGLACQPNLNGSIELESHLLRTVCRTPSITDPNGPPERSYKIIFIGDASVGKSSFILRITKNTFVAQLSSTLGVDFQVRTFCIDGKNVTLQLWDTAGQERCLTNKFNLKLIKIKLITDFEA